MNKIFMGIIVALFALSCLDPDLIDQAFQDELNKRIEGITAISITGDIEDGYEKDGISYYTGADGAGNPTPVILSYVGTGDGELVYSAKVNNISTPIINNSISIIESSLSIVLIVVQDKFERRAYLQKKIFIDRDKPVVAFVNTSTSIRLDKIDSFVDSVPGNALRDVGVGLNFDTQRGWWKSGIPTVAGPHIRCFSVKDFAGNESDPYELEVTVLSIPVYPEGMAIVDLGTITAYESVFSVEYSNEPTDLGVTWFSGDESVLKFTGDGSSAIILATGSVTITAVSIMTDDGSQIFSASKTINTSVVGEKTVNGVTLKLVYPFEFMGTRKPSIISSISDELKFDTAGVMTYIAKNNSGLSRTMTLDSNFAGESFSYVEMAFKYSSSELLSNIYMATDTPYGLVFSKNGSTYFLNGDWNGVGSQSISLDSSGGLNVIGLLETETGGIITSEVNEYVKGFERSGTVYNGGTGTFNIGFNTDGGGSDSTIVSIDYIRFYAPKIIH